MYFDKVKVNDRVWGYVHGRGRVVKINSPEEDDIFRARVHFPDSHMTMDFTADGFCGGVNQRLFYYDDRPVIIDRKSHETEFDKLYEELQQVSKDRDKLLLELQKTTNSNLPFDIEIHGPCTFKITNGILHVHTEATPPIDHEDFIRS